MRGLGALEGLHAEQRDTLGDKVLFNVIAPSLVYAKAHYNMDVHLNSVDGVCSLQW
jgi:hypothetical protein